ncbi:MAG: hypothetical protein LQ348_001252 [Seirophora lacunosa]|nr:MAG: hypothetical protein LQ348_001252 [Seirophora lacunosa]
MDGPRTSPSNNPKAPAPTADQDPVWRGAPPVVSSLLVAELGTTAPPLPPPPAALTPLSSLVSVELLSSPVSEGIMLEDVLLIIMLSPEVAEPIMLEPIMEAPDIILELIMETSDIILEPVIVAESSIMDPVALAPDAMSEAEVTRLATPLGLSVPTAAAPCAKTHVSGSGIGV